MCERCAPGMIPYWVEGLLHVLASWRSRGGGQNSQVLEFTKQLSVIRILGIQLRGLGISSHVYSAVTGHHSHCRNNPFLCHAKDASICLHFGSSVLLSFPAKVSQLASSVVAPSWPFQPLVHRIQSQNRGRML